MVESTMIMMNHKIIQHFRMSGDSESGDSETIIAWRSKGLSDESIKPTNVLGNSLALKLKWIHNSKKAVKQGKATFTHRNVVNLFIVYELNTWSTELYTKFTLGDCLLVAKNVVFNKCGYNAYDIGFGTRSQFSLPIGKCCYFGCGQ